MELIRTGNSDLDEVLGGGFAPGSLVVVAGSPGTGKTILAQQVVFANATAERPALYYTTLSEPHSKLVRHLESFEFFDRGKLGDSVSFLHITEMLQGVFSGERGIDAFREEVVEKAFEQSPSFVVIDSSKALHHFADDSRLREAIFSLASTVSHTGAVLMLVGEYTKDELETAPEFAVADGIIHLGVSGEGPMERRWLRVVKMRGRDYLGGEHTFQISRKGYKLFPRLESIAPSRSPDVIGRHGFGVDKLDEMTGGGLPSGQGTLVMGPSGSGKTILASHFATDGIAAGQRVLFLSLEETVKELLEKGAAFGFGLEAATESGNLKLAYLPPMELEIDELGGQLREVIDEFDPHRVVVDGIADIVLTSRRMGRFPNFLWALMSTLRAAEASVILTYEVAAIGGVNQLDAISYLFHNVIVLRYMERGSELGRVLNVLKMRSSAHAKGLLQFEIADDGLNPIGSPGDVKSTLGWTVIGGPTGGTS
ncbi:MAG: ATPase domain-containing protein [Nitriliruptorales bacterium]|nr:ATPase domain-containing protein [Nitriliruptorales bacterium]